MYVSPAEYLYLEGCAFLEMLLCISWMLEVQVKIAVIGIVLSTAMYKNPAE